MNSVWGKALIQGRSPLLTDVCASSTLRLQGTGKKYVPIMSDFYEILMNQPEDEAKDIALSLELFVNGSLNIFNH